MDEFRVIEIVDKRRLITNYGKVNGAKIGDKVEVYSIGREVIDPIKKESLGTWDIIKSQLTITEVYKLFSICEKTETYTSTILNPLIGRDFITSKTEHFDLFVDESSITNHVNPDKQPIEVGDFVRKID